MWEGEYLHGLRRSGGVVHLLATEGSVHGDRNHLWHMETLRPIAAADGSVVLTVPRRDEAGPDATVALHAALQYRGRTYADWNRFHVATRAKVTALTFQAREGWTDRTDGVRGSLR